MRHLLLHIIFFFLFYSSYSYSQSVKPVNSNAFKRGEKLTFRVHYGFIDAGIATLEVKEDNRVVAGKNTYHIVGTGKSNRFFDLFFRVRDKFETYMDEEALLPLVFIRKCDEGGYLINQNQIYNHITNSVRSTGIGGWSSSISGKSGDEKQFPVPEGVQDMLSAFFSARNYDISTIQIGDTVKVPAFVDNENWVLMIKFAGRDTITNDLGKFAALKFNPVVQVGRVFKDEKDMAVYISDDKNHIPIRGEAKILVGSIAMDLIEYENLANPVSKIGER